MTVSDPPGQTTVAPNASSLGGVRPGGSDTDPRHPARHRRFVGAVALAEAVLQAGLAQHKKEGFAKEWELHHQGGPTGYAGRDIVVTPEETRTVAERQAVAWNPSITGAKTEDTFILDAGKRIVVTQCSEHWPQITVAGPSGAKLTRPAILVR